MLRRAARTIRNRLYGVQKFEIPVHLAGNFKQLSHDSRQDLIDRLLTSHFSNPQYYLSSPEQYLQTSHGQEDMENHIEGRLNRFRAIGIPWIDSILPLKRARLLEIGCGTGTSTVALAEQGAKVTAFDVDSMSLACCNARLGYYGLKAEILKSNAINIWGDIQAKDYDAIVCVALLEHMTLEERIDFLSKAWNFLRPGGFLIVDDTPNRLWFHDAHTAYENFYFWLPDDLAMRWAPRTKRSVFNEIFKSSTDRTLFARWGRGVSYHDFCLAFDFEPSRLPVHSSKQGFLRKATRTTQINVSPFERFMRKQEPTIDAGFFVSDIEIAFMK